MIPGLPIVVFTPSLVERSRGDRAVEILRPALEEVSAIGGPCLLITPAGIATVQTEQQALDQAEEVRAIARRAGVALIFGIDVGPPQPNACRLFACFGGAPVLWPCVGQRVFPGNIEQRLLRLGDTPVLPLFAKEALDPLASRLVAQIRGLAAVVILSHGGATARWKAPLSRLEKQIPLIVAAHHGGAGRGYATAILGAKLTTARSVREREPLQKMAG